MLSMPPATTILAEPALMTSWANITARMPEPQTLEMVVQPTPFGSPAPSAACRAGAWPRPADSTLPMNTSSTASPAKPARSSAARMAAAPSCGPVRPMRSPWKPPIGVRAAAAMTMLSVMVVGPFPSIFSVRLTPFP